MRQLIAAAVIALLVAACYDGPDNPGRNDGSNLDFTSKATIVIDDRGIQPAVTAGKVGDAITVINRGTKDHGLTSDTIDTGTLRPGESTTVFLTEAGTIKLRDRADSSHEAQIDVQDVFESS